MSLLSHGQKCRKGDEVAAMVIDWHLLKKGWKQRRLIILDNAGCPRWLARLRCPTAKCWGDLLIALCEARRIYPEAEMKRKEEDARRQPNLL